MQLPDNCTIAVVGASNDPTKYGHRVLKNLLEREYRAFPVNLKEDEILGQQVYHSIKEYPDTIELVVFVIPPSASESVLQEVIELAIDKVWFQPGSSNERCLELCQDNNLEYQDGLCIMHVDVPCP